MDAYNFLPYEESYGSPTDLTYFTSEPLSRYGSSGGSSYTSTSTTSTSFPSSPTYHRSLPDSIVCLSPNCTAKPFKRRADLERHYRHRHEPDSIKESWPCDYSRCPRRSDPFHRRDHFRDHLREYHREDIEKRGVEVADEWYQGRSASVSWWRCGRCLMRVGIEESGFDCPDCKGRCQARRQEMRRR